MVQPRKTCNFLLAFFFLIHVSFDSLSLSLICLTGHPMKVPFDAAMRVIKHSVKSYSYSQRSTSTNFRGRSMKLPRTLGLLLYKIQGWTLNFNDSTNSGNLGKWITFKHSIIIFYTFRCNAINQFHKSFFSITLLRINSRVMETHFRRFWWKACPKVKCGTYSCLPIPIAFFFFCRILSFWFLKEMFSPAIFYFGAMCSRLSKSEVRPLLVYRTFSRNCIYIPNQ